MQFEKRFRFVMVVLLAGVHLGTPFAPRCFADEGGEFEERTTEEPAREERTVLLPVLPTAATLSQPPGNFSEILRALLLESLDEVYEDDRHWRGTVERFDGFRVRGLRISKREREVPHGFWHRYRVSLIRPEDTFEVQIRQADPTASGAIPFLISIRLRARCEATFVWWTYGVKGLNGTAVSHATVQLNIRLETSPKIAFSLEQPIPRLDLQPKLTTVQLKLKDLDVRQFGIFDGDVVKVLGDGSREAVERLMQQQSKKLQAKLQKRIDAAVKPDRGKSGNPGDS